MLQRNISLGSVSMLWRCCCSCSSGYIQTHLVSSPVCRMMLAVCVSANCRFIWGWCLYQTCHVTFTLQAHWVTFHIRRLSLYITMTKTGIFKTNHDLFVSFPDPNRVVVMTVWWLGNFINLLKKNIMFWLKIPASFTTKCLESVQTFC